jgi:hypothetical protein
MPRPLHASRGGPTGIRGLLPSAVLLFLVTSCDTPVAPRIDILPSQGRVELHAVRGSLAPVEQTITVTNTGGGRLGPVSCAAEPAPWLGCEVSDGNQVRLVADPIGLTSSPEPVSVELTAPGATATVLVALVLGQPVLTVAPATLEFTAAESASGTTPGSATATVTNTGAGTLASLGGLTCTRGVGAGHVACAVDAVAGILTVTVDPSGVAPGTHVYPLTVAAQHSDATQSLTVTLAKAASPRIGLSRQSLHFEAIRGAETPLVGTVTVSNTGGGQLSGLSCPAAPAAWLTCAVSGSTLTFTARPAGLTETPTTVAVPVSATNALNSPQAVNVSFAIGQPVLTLNRTALSFTAIQDSTATPAQDTVRARNTGAGGLADLGTIACAVPVGAPLSCTIAAETGILTVVPDPEGLSQGVYQYPLRVSAAHSSVSYLINVTLTVQARPTLAADPGSLHFNAIRGTSTAITRIVTISNKGGGSLGELHCPSGPAAWLTCTVLDSARVQLTARPAGLTTSPAAVEVPITAAFAVNSPLLLPVSFILEQPVLAVSETQVTFAGNAATGATTPASYTLSVSNTGAGDTHNLGTLACSATAPVTCVVDSAAAQLTLSVNATGLASGRHVWIATVTAQHAANVSVSITVVLDIP